MCGIERIEGLGNTEILNSILKLVSDRFTYVEQQKINMVHMNTDSNHHFILLILEAVIPAAVCANTCTVEARKFKENLTLAKHETYCIL